MEILQRNISTYGIEIDSLINLITTLTFTWFFIALFTMLYFLFRYRKRKNIKAVYEKGEGKKIWYVLIPVLFVVLSDITLDISSSKVWFKVKGDVDELIPNPDLEIRIIARQYAWQFDYIGPDKKWGTDDDLSSFNVMKIPANKTVVFHLSSKDVIHSFWVKNLRLKQDAIPGRVIKGWFKVDGDLLGNPDWQEYIDAESIYNKQIQILGLRETLSKIKMAPSLIEKKKLSIKQAKSEFIQKQEYLKNLLFQIKKLEEDIKQSKKIQDLVKVSHLELKLNKLVKQTDKIKRLKKLIDSGPDDFQNLKIAIRHRKDLIKEYEDKLIKAEKNLIELLRDNQEHQRLFEIACAEICGVNHTIMNAWMVIDSEDQFERWYSGKS